MKGSGILDLIQIINYIEEDFNLTFFSKTGEPARDYFYEGYCIYYATLLKRLFPDGKIMLDLQHQHAYFELFDLYFDVRDTHRKEEFPKCINLEDSPCSEISFFHTGYSNKEAEEIINYLEQVEKKRLFVLSIGDSDENYGR